MGASVLSNVTNVTNDVTHNNQSSPNASRSQPHQLDRQLNKIMAITLRNPTFVHDGWVRDGHAFVARSLDLRFSPETSEVLWRNDELRPVPDSMVRSPTLAGPLINRLTVV